ncbi:MAG: outer membrane lipoprotein-sorting protein [bacterium]
MHKPSVIAALLLLALNAPARAADKPEALLQRMQAWLEPAQPSTRRLTVNVRSGGETATWTAGQARGPIDGGRAVLTVLLEPKDLRGTALLVRQQTGKAPEEWLYLPYLRRVRKIVPVDEFESFLNTELTYADLGFVNLADRAVTGLGAANLDGVAVMQLQEVPKDRDTFSRIVSSVVPATGQPIKREYYDVANRLWKVGTFENVATVHEVPTAQRIRMEDVQTGFGTELRATDIAFGLPIPPALFDPAQLSKAANAWP